MVTKKYLSGILPVRTNRFQSKIPVTLLVFSFVILAGSFSCYAQTYAIKGRIVNNFKKEPIPGATVTANKLRDSTQVAATIADAEGIFELEKIPVKDTVFMEVRSIGFKTWRAKLYFKGHVPSMDSVFLMEDITELEAVEVEAERPAMVTRGDTVEYRAASYQTRPYAEVKELLNKLPGLSKDINGNLLFNGRKISKILVDGREYFGSDGQMALNTIPVDVVEKIQVMNNTENKLNAKDISDEKVLNIELKENVRMFGNAVGGGGTTKRYEATGMLNCINGDSRLAFYGLGNNVNVTYYNPGAVSLTSPGNGQIETLSGGMDYSDILGNKTAFSGNVNFNFPNSHNESLLSRTQFLVPDSSFFTDTNSDVRNNSLNISLSATMQPKAKSYGNVQFGIQGLTYSRSDNRMANITSTSGQDGTPVNNLENVLSENVSRTNLPLFISWDRRFKNNMYANVRGFSGWGNESANNFNKGVGTFYKNGIQDSVALLNQQIIKSNTTAVYGIQVGCTLPMIKKLSMSVSNNLQLTQSDRKTDTWKLDEANEKSALDTLYSNSFHSLIISDYFTYTLNYEAKTLGIYAGISVNYNNLNQDDRTRNQDLVQETLNWSPNIRINHRLPNGQITLSYTASTSPPTPQQLQPVADNTNPLFVQQGNPGLRPAFSQGYDLNFSKASSEGTSSFYGNLSFRPVKNTIISTVRVDEDGRQISGYMNVDGVMSMASSLRYSIRIKKEKHTLQTNLGVGINYSQNKNFINERLAANRIINASPQLQISYDLQNVLTLSAGYAPGFTKVDFEYSSSQNQQFVAHNVQTTLDCYPLKNFTWRSFIGFIYNGSQPAGFTKSTTFWNMELSYLMLKSKKGELKLRVYDLLRQNQNLSRSVSQNYIESTQSNNLQQYFMLTFKYHIR